MWELTRIGLGGHNPHEVGIRDSISQTCPEVYKIYVPDVLPESAPGCIVYWLKCKSQCFITIGVQHLRCWGLLPNYSVVIRLIENQRQSVKNSFVCF